MPIGREDHAGMAGPFTLIETKEESRTALRLVQRRLSLCASTYAIPRSKNPTGPMLTLTQRGWSAFVAYAAGN
ncbi:DUF397 domain-containing protein [Streptomyces halstedii]|uniref:DUF397 domain-containing protein n=1 Tax=Streptomyces halstedii TaxID=1944 RepID=UPI00369F91B6